MGASPEGRQCPEGWSPGSVGRQAALMVAPVGIDGHTQHVVGGGSTVLPWDACIWQLHVARPMESQGGWSCLDPLGTWSLCSSCPLTLWCPFWVPEEWMGAQPQAVCVVGRRPPSGGLPQGLFSLSPACWLVVGGPGRCSRLTLLSSAQGPAALGQDRCERGVLATARLRHHGPRGWGGGYRRRQHMACIQPHLPHGLRPVSVS